MKLYVSWIPGLHKNPEAVAIIKACPHIDAVEYCSDDEAEIRELKDAGLNVSIHNPFRSKKLSLKDPGFAAALQCAPRLLALNDAPLIGFHIAYEHPDDGSDEEVMLRCIAHIRAACALLGKEHVAFEAGPYFPELGVKLMSSPAIIRRLLAETDAGFLFDMSHLFITAANMGKERGRPVDEILDELVEMTRGRVVQMHLNVPTWVNGRYDDLHATLGDDALSSRIWRLAQDVLDANPGIKVVTLEMYTSKDVVAHARAMVAQAELVRRLLDRRVLLQE
jgi:uncharacterized protein (UPF0276 family)